MHQKPFVTLGLIVAGISFLLPQVVAGSEPADSPQFETHVRAIFKKHCFHCHGEEEHPEGSLDLRLVRFMHSGGDSGPAIIPGAADESVLFQRMRDGEMPPDESKLCSEEELEIVRQWIEAGATTLRPEPESIDDTMLITEEERSHWSLQPIVRPSVPQVADAEAVANPIDAFLLAKLEARGFGFSPRAPANALIRRLFIDLHGVPPTPQDVEAFAADNDQVAWQQWIDRLLSKHEYGERWARHWLDVAGYADSEGYNDVDAPRPHAWRYRDYVIRAFNNDKPFDRFIHEQLAGDEMISTPLNNLSAEDAELLTATGFLRMAPDGTGGAVDDVNVARNATIADTVTIVSSSLLAMTVGCAQCHDHRYDPISHEDYFRFRAIFEPGFDWQKWRSPPKRLVSLYTDAMRAEAAKVEAEAKKLDAKRIAKQTEFINATFEKQLEKLPEETHELARETHKTPAKKRTDEQKALIKKYPKLNVTASSLYLYDRKASDELKAMAAEAKKVRDTKPKQEFVRALTEVPGRVPVTQLFYRGDHEQPKQELQPGGLTVVSMNVDLPEVPANDTALPTTGRRLAFARRLTDPKHPLTARALVNRIWMHHFGRGLVTSPNDFGVLGQPPSHPELLDWLASEFIDSGWSLKHIHRLILSSTAWQQQLRVAPDQIAADPDNELYGGARLLRLDAEAIRDSMLAIADQINSKPFGPAIPVMPDPVGRFVIGIENSSAGRPGAVIDMKGEDLRRSVYVQVRRSQPLSVLEAFDQPIMTPNCDLRRPSTSSTQSLMMLNSDQVLEYSRLLAERLQRDAADDLDTQIQLAWRLIFARDCSDDERAAAKDLVAEQAAIFATQPAYKADAKKKPQRTPDQEALATLCQMLFSSNEFLYVD
ncbi:Planctomycete cytochrome C [Rosistilla oblonga]|uniref:PSD1 and planctomycete cytochrome C domain-containing protein n=1 Tax=Rosistilla oblonga TaxID=2527990 RepID=UPI001187C097|nr:PSD1 and planctomycete cytochrome C domain-containing protein [Rosistilla oblonga]QDV13478.1 Planctomycete cytochrome C [Rosistilla oblonga]